MEYKVIANRPGRVTYRVTGANLDESDFRRYEKLANQLDPNNFGYYVQVDSPECIIIDIYTD